MIAPKAFCIRKATECDKDVIAFVYAACFGKTLTAAAVDELLRGTGCWAFILEVKGPKNNIIPVGFVIGRSILDEAEILYIGVDCEFQRYGFALELMQSAIKEAKARRATMLYLEVAEDNHPACNLYKRLGFDAVGRRQGYYLKADGSRVDAINLSFKIT